MTRTIKEIIQAEKTEKANVLNFTLQRLAASVRERQILLDGFRAQAKIKAAEFRADGEIVTEADEETIAVNLMMREGYVPPHFTGEVDCAKCGFMPADAGYKRDKVHACMWWHTDYGLSKALASKEIPLEHGFTAWRERNPDPSEWAID